MTMSVREACPECGSQQCKRNGHIHNGQQNHQCKVCGRQFVLVASNRVMSEEHRTLLERLLCEKISRHGIYRTIGVSIRWLMDFMVACFAAVPEHLLVQPMASSGAVLPGCQDVEADELWSFVQQKTNPHWVWLAIDKQTRQRLAFHIADRSRDSAKQLWAKIPARYRESATF